MGIDVTGNPAANFSGDVNIDGELNTDGVISEVSGGRTRFAGYFVSDNHHGLYAASNAMYSQAAWFDGDVRVNGNLTLESVFFNSKDESPLAAEGKVYFSNTAKKLFVFSESYWRAIVTANNDGDVIVDGNVEVDNELQSASFGFGLLDGSSGKYLLKQGWDGANGDWVRIGTGGSSADDEYIQVTANRGILLNGGNVGIGTTNPTYPLHMGSGARCTAGGVWTDASSKKYKENIEDLPLDDALEVLSGLNPVTFNYKADKDEQYAGFIAEDVTDLVAMQDKEGLSPMDIVAVLTKVVQGQHNQIEELKAEIVDLKGKVE